MSPLYTPKNLYNKKILLLFHLSKDGGKGLSYYIIGLVQPLLKVVKMVLLFKCCNVFRIKEALVISFIFKSLILLV